MSYMRLCHPYNSDNDKNPTPPHKKSEASFLFAYVWIPMKSLKVLKEHKSVSSPHTSSMICGWITSDSGHGPKLLLRASDSALWHLASFSLPINNDAMLTRFGANSTAEECGCVRRSHTERTALKSRSNN